VGGGSYPPAVSAPRPTASLRAVLVACLLAVALPAARGVAATLPYVPLDHWATPLIAEALERGYIRGISLADRPFRRADVVRALEAARDEAEDQDRDYSPFEAWLLLRLESEFTPNDPGPTSAFSRVAEDWAGGYGVEARGYAYAGEDHRRLGVADGRGQILPYAGF